MSQQYSLPEYARAAIIARYRYAQGVAKVALLTQGEKDQLEEARQRLGWPTILSLAVKYYPLYPCRKWWHRALTRTSHHRIHTATLNISYLLLTLETIKKWGLQAAYQSTVGSVNRLTQRYKDKETNRLTHRDQGGLVNVPQDPKRMTAFMARAVAPGGGQS